MLSVIIPVYKAETFIERCARSLFEQTLKDIEYIFVDDQTPDNSIDVLERVMNEYPETNVRILHHERNRGAAAARQTGLDAAQGEWIGWCDADDWCELGMFAHLVNKGEQENADIVCCNFWIDNGVCRTERKTDYSNESYENILNPYRRDVEYTSLWNKIIRKRLYIDNNIRFIEGVDMWEDCMMTIRLRWLSRKTVHIAEPLYHYFSGERNSVFFSVVDMHKVDDMVAATNCLEKFFEHQDAAELAKNFIANMKLKCKERLMACPSKETLRRWRELYPNNDLNVWKFKNYSFASKIKITLCRILPMSLAWWIFRVRR